MTCLPEELLVLLQTSEHRLSTEPLQLILLPEPGTELRLVMLLLCMILHDKPVVSGALYVCRFDGDVKSPDGMQLVDEYHSQYVAALKALWNDNKDKYAKRRVSELQTVE